MLNEQEINRKLIKVYPSVVPFSQRIIISKEIEPFLSNRVKFFWNKYYDRIGDKNSHDLHAAFLTQGCIFPIEDFAKFINKCAEDDIIHTGVLCNPFKIQVYKDRYRYMFFAMTNKTFSELQDYEREYYSNNLDKHKKSKSCQPN